MNNIFIGIRADISCVAGVNAIAEFSMTGGGEWTATTGVTNIKQIQNDSLYKNTGLVGVYPYGCDDCTASVKPPKCKHHKKYATPQSKPICNISRNAATSSGGSVLLTFIGYTE